MRNKQGITLIALVITIIILIILAGVTINIIFDDNGIINKAKEGAGDYKNAEVEEQNILAQAEGIVESSILGIPIPAGFTVSTVPGETTIEEGLVVIAPDGSQFVWVPVANPVLDVTGAVNNTAINNAIQAEVTAGRYPMAIKVNATDYKGVLYDFSGTTVPATITAKTYTTGGTDYREPNVLTDTTFGDTDSTLSIYGIGLTQSAFQIQLQSEYNNMVESVITNGGFFIGRYETSLSGGNAQSKENGTPMAAINWWNMYAKEKAYTSANGITGVTSGMIYGSQWDQVMIWMEDVANANASNSPYIVDSTGMGNYSGAKTNTGINSNYKVKNIYDMAGNVLEWTQEAFVSQYRVVRGGYYYYGGSYFSTSYRYDGEPTTTYTDIGSRAQLYL